MVYKRDNTQFNVLSIYKIEIFWWHKPHDSDHHAYLSFPKMTKDNRVKEKSFLGSGIFCIILPKYNDWKKGGSCDTEIKKIVSIQGIVKQLRCYLQTLCRVIRR